MNMMLDSFVAEKNSENVNEHEAEGELYVEVHNTYACRWGRAMWWLRVDT